MEKYFEINYTIEDIQGMSHEEQLEYLEYLYDLQTEIMRQIDDKKSFYSEINLSNHHYAIPNANASATTALQIL